MDSERIKIIYQDSNHIYFEVYFRDEDGEWYKLKLKAKKKDLKCV